MTKTSETIVFFGNERLATGVTTTAPALRGLIDNGYKVAAVVVNYTTARSRSAQTRELEVMRIATEHGIPVLSPNKLSDIVDQLRAYQPMAGVLLAYGRIVPQSILDIFPRGIINIHPSLLPLHRGPMPIESAILEGATETGVSLMQLSKAMDAGPIYAQTKIRLSGSESKQALYDELLRQGVKLLLNKLPAILAGKIASQTQDESEATYDKLLSKDAGIIDWAKPAEALEREVRAFLGWPGSRGTIAGKEVIITKARVEASSKYQVTSNKIGEPFATPEKELAVATGKDLLIIEKLKPAGKREMTGREFLAGHRPMLK